MRRTERSQLCQSRTFTQFSTKVIKCIFPTLKVCVCSFGITWIRINGTDRSLGHGATTETMNPRPCIVDSLPRLMYHDLRDVRSFTLIRIISKYFFLIYTAIIFHYHIIVDEYIFPCCSNSNLIISFCGKLVGKLSE